MSLRPAIFIGSSSEGLKIAKGIQAELSPVAEVTVWSQGVFQPTYGYLESLTKALEAADFAVLVLTPDDFTESRGDSAPSPRDNVVFELGLFLGRLGRERTFFVYDNSQPLKLPSDLLGIAAATFGPRNDGNIQAAVGPACNTISSRVLLLGPRTRLLKFSSSEMEPSPHIPSVKGTWAGYDPEGPDPAVQVSTLLIEQHGSFIRATIERKTTEGGERTFEYEGRFSAGQLVLFYEDSQGRGYIVGTMVLHLSADLRSLKGRTTYHSHDENRVVSFPREYKKIST